MTGLIILAAGASSRLGEPKQNLVYRQKTLLQNAMHAGISSGCNPIITVLGANADMILPHIKGMEGISIAINPEWQEGISSSIRTGIAELGKDERVNDAIIILCDQPFVNSELLLQMQQAKQQTDKAIVACHYAGTPGVPVLFDKTMFAELLKLRGNEGAKNILKDHPHDMATIAFDKGSIDIDTKDDYNKLLDANN